MLRDFNLCKSLPKQKTNSWKMFSLINAVWIKLADN